MYILKNYKRSKHIRITVRPDGTVLVTKPTFVSVRYAKEFVQSKRVWIENQLKKSKESTNPELCVYTRAHFDMHKERALMFIEGKVERWNRIYCFDFNQIKVKRMSTRWGSCSNKRNLNFNYKLIFLPERLIDYVVVHELCHLKEFNHSVNFWTLIEKTIPNYKKIRKELSKIK